MKKIIKSNILLLSILFLLCACSVKNDSQMTISKDGKMDYNILIAFDKELIEGLNAFENDSTDKVIGINDLINENIKDDHLKDFNEEKYSDNNYTGNLYTYSIDNIDLVSSSDLGNVNINDENGINNKKLFNKNNNIYSANFIYNLEEKEVHENVNFINTFTVNLPTRNITSNADKVLDNGKTLIWNIKNGEEKKINFSFKLYDSKYAYISIGSIIFDLILVGIFIFIKLKRV